MNNFFTKSLTQQDYYTINSLHLKNQIQAKRCFRFINHLVYSQKAIFSTQHPKQITLSKAAKTRTYEAITISKFV